MQGPVGRLVYALHRDTMAAESKVVSAEGAAGRLTPVGTSAVDGKAEEEVSACRLNATSMMGCLVARTPQQRCVAALVHCTVAYN